MKEPRAFASLSSSLLARKGRARPAMRPNSGKAIEDLGWNDMGDSDVNAVTPPQGEITSLPVAYQAELEANFPPQEKEPAPKKTTFVAKKASVHPIGIKSRVRQGQMTDIVKARSAFTLRLDAERHLRLRLACAVSNRSAQKIVMQALDAWLDTIPEIDELAGRVPPRAKTGLS